MKIAKLAWSGPGRGYFGYCQVTCAKTRKVEATAFTGHKLPSGRYEIRCSEHLPDGGIEIRWKLATPFQTPTGTEMALREMGEAWRHKRELHKVAYRLAMKDDTLAKMTPAQDAVLDKMFPATTSCFEKLKGAKTPEERKVLTGQLEAAFIAESMAYTGKLPTPITEAETVRQMIPILAKMTRRSGVNPAHYELVRGWYAEGYCDMTPEQRAEQLRECGFDSVTADAIKKFCDRVQLPKVRRPGRPH